MKRLLDEMLPHRLRHELPGHDCYTVQFMSYGSLENGELLARSATENFDALITKDTNLHYQQNLDVLPIAVVVLHCRSNDIFAIRPVVPSLLEILKTLAPRSVSHVHAP